LDRGRLSRKTLNVSSEAEAVPQARVPHAGWAAAATARRLLLLLLLLLQLLLLLLQWLLLLLQSLLLHLLHLLNLLRLRLRRPAPHARAGVAPRAAQACAGALRVEAAQAFRVS
jgi:hypothetical protein